MSICCWQNSFANQSAEARLHFARSEKVLEEALSCLERMVRGILSKIDYHQ